MNDRADRSTQFILDAFVAEPERFLTAPEDQWFDRKSLAVALREIAKALVAFANAEGGAVALGVSREHGLGGVQSEPTKVNAIRQVALDLTEPPVRHLFHRVPCRNRRGEQDEVIVLEVEPSERMHRLTNGSVWLRVGDETRELDHEQALQLGYDKGVSYFDNERAVDVTIEDLNIGAAERYRERLQSQLEPRQLLEARGLYRERGANAGETWAGLLLF